MSTGERQSSAFFESRYKEASDPWDFASSAYELSRYQATLSALAKDHYRSAYEPGCSVGVLTAQLAKRCERVMACDISPTAVRRARKRCVSCENVTIDVRNVAEAAPGGCFDLIVFSELGYYFAVEQLAALAAELATRLESGGEFIAVHWLGNSADHVLHGDVVYEVLAASLSLDLIQQSRHKGFRIDSWRHA